MPPTPTTPSLGTYTLNGKAEKPAASQSVASAAPKLSQSVGPGRVPSPTMKSKRPSLPRPESPQRKTQHASSTPQTRPSIGKPSLSKSMIGGPRHAPSPVPPKFGGSVRGTKDLTGDPGKRVPVTPKPAIRKPTGARPISPTRGGSQITTQLGPEPLFDEDSDNTPVGLNKTKPPTRNSQQTSRPTSNQDTEIRLLRTQLQERDRQLEKYASDLDEMQNSITELQTLSPRTTSTNNRSSRESAVESLDAPSLRALVREKDEKIATLIREFDSHRADFRETIDILEHTADETNRHYEERLAHLEGQLRDHNDREGDVQSVAEQLLTLERHVEELEEGLEDSRRGESEARAEVEHLRGEVERGKAEMRREKEKAAVTRAYSGESASDSRYQREIAHRDNEINGLKAIIHSLSRDPSSTSPSSPRSSRRSKQDTSNQANDQADARTAEERRRREQLEREIKELQDLVDRKTYREEELEQEVQRLHKHTSQLSSAPSNDTAVANNSTASRHNSSSHIRTDSRRDRAVVASPTTLDPSDDNHSSTTQLTDNSALWCEMCETSGHDILHCTSMSGSAPPPRSQPQPPASIGVYRPQYRSPSTNDIHSANSKGKDRDDIGPAPKTRMPNPMDSGMVAGRESGVVDSTKWCALCERDGHESVDCPFDDVL